MDFVERAKNIIVQPKEEWPKIAQETATIQEIYLNYVVILAAIPAVAGFIGLTLLGGVFGGFGASFGAGVGLFYLIQVYVISLVSVIVFAFIIDALAPTFGSEKNLTQAFKLTVYAHTASWVAGVFLIIPLLGWLVTLVGAIYGIYLFYLGLPVMMKTPEQKVIPYMVVCALIVIVLSWALHALVRF